MIPIKDNIALLRLPLVTYALVAINVIVYLLSIRHGGSFFGGPSESVEVRWGAIPYEFTHPSSHCALLAATGPQGESVSTVACTGQAGVLGSAPSQPATWQTAFSSMFLHASFLHIAGNMLFLAIFGPAVEDAIGRLRYGAFYLLGGLVALAVQVLASPGSTSPTLGASGAIAAVLGGYLLMYPRARVLSLVIVVFFVTLVELPAVVLLGFWIILQVIVGLTGLARSGGEGAAYFAHIGGFAFGLLAIKLLARRHPPRRAIAAL